MPERAEPAMQVPGRDKLILPEAPEASVSDLVDELSSNDRAQADQGQGILSGLAGRIKSLDAAGKAIAISAMLFAQGCATTLLNRVEQSRLPASVAAEKRRHTENQQRFSGKIEQFKALRAQRGDKYVFRTYNLLTEESFSYLDFTEATELARNPLDFLDRTSGEFLQVDPELLPEQKREIKVVPFELKEEKFGGGKGRLKIYDWLAGGKLVFDKEYDVGSKKDGRAPFDSGVMAFLQAHEEQVRQYEVALNDTSGQSHHPPIEFSVRLRKDLPMSAESRAALQRVVRKFTIHIAVNPENSEVDRRSLGFELTPEAIDRLEHPISVNGQFEHIRFNSRGSSPTTSYDAERGLINGKSSFEEKIDAVGNQVNIVLMPSRTEHYTSVFIYPPITFADKKTTGDSTPVNLDLTHVGDGRIPDLLRARVERPVPGVQKGPYTVYSNLPDVVVQGELSQEIPGLAAGVEQCEKVFGFKAGELVHELYVVRAYGSNADFSPRNPTTVRVQDELLLTKLPQGGKLAGFHECAHLIDARLSLSSREAVQIFFAQHQSSDLINGLNESIFFGIPGENLGHAKMSAEEFWASLINTLNNDIWRDRIASEQKEFKKFYADALRLVLRVVEGEPAINKKAPIVEMVRERLRVLGE